MNTKYNDYHENLLKRWAQMSKTYSIMHTLCAQYYSVWDKRLGIPLVILGAVTASSIFGSGQTGTPIYMNYINGGLALVVTALAGVSKFIGTSEKQVKHQTASFKYTSISMEIDTLLSFPRGDRSSQPQEFISSIKSRILEVRENTPEVLPWIIGSYLKNYDRGLVNIKSKINTKFGITNDEELITFQEAPKSQRNSITSQKLFQSTVSSLPSSFSNKRRVPKEENKKSVYEFDDPMTTQMMNASAILVSDSEPPSAEEYDEYDEYEEEERDKVIDDENNKEEKDKNDGNIILSKTLHIV